jgi:hypothetical protein
VCILRRVATTCSLEAPFAGLGHPSNDEIRSSPLPRSRPAARAAHVPRPLADGDRPATGELNNMPSTVGAPGSTPTASRRYREVDFHLASELGPAPGCRRR